MSARRETRARKAPLQRLSAPSAVPGALLVSRCIEVWAEPGSEDPRISTMRRVRLARQHFGREVEADDRELRELIPHGSPWSVHGLSYPGQAERAGRPLGEIVAERLDRAGCAVQDIPALAEDADELYATALGGVALTRAYRRGPLGERSST